MKESLVSIVVFVCAVTLGVSLFFLLRDNRALYERTCSPDIYVGNRGGFIVESVVCMPRESGAVRVVKLP